jgi:hypothetical protein
MRTTALAKQDACPFCGHTLDAVTAGPESPDATPEPGDYSVCIKCASLMVFGDGLKVRAPTEAEQDEAMSLPDTVSLLQAIRRLTR